MLGHCQAGRIDPLAAPASRQSAEDTLQTLNYKVGDLAIVVNADLAANVGRIVEVTWEQAGESVKRLGPGCLAGTRHERPREPLRPLPDRCHRLVRRRPCARLPTAPAAGLRRRRGPAFGRRCANAATRSADRCGRWARVAAVSAMPMGCSSSMPKTAAQFLALIKASSTSDRW